ncbi:MAG: FUSC family protein, partial [Acidimicrobiales bacterium]
MQKDQIDVRAAVRCTIGVMVPLVVGLGTGALGLGVAAAVGALSSGFASFQGAYRSRVATTLIVAAGMAVSTILGAVADHSGVAAVAVVVLWGAGAGMMVCLGPAALVTGLQWVVAVLIVGAFAMTPTQALVRGGMVMAGGIFQTLLVVVVWPLRAHPVERRSVAAVYASLAVLALAVARGEGLAPGGTSLDEARRALEDPQPFGRASELQVYTALVDEAERIRIELSVLARHVAAEAAPSAGPESDFAAAAAVVLEGVASAIHSGDEPPTGEALHDLIALERAPIELSDADANAAEDKPGVDRPFRRPSTAPGRSWAEDDLARTTSALAGQLRSALRLTGILGRRPRGLALGERTSLWRGRHRPELREAGHTLRANLSWQSSTFRHAVRLATVLGVATVVFRASELPHGYWLGLTALVVLRPDFATTTVRGVSRVAGTLLGAGATSVIAAFLRPGNGGLTVLFGATIFLAYLTIRANYLLFSICVTSYVVFLLAFVRLPTSATVTARLTDTVIGGALALGAYLVWPTWESRLVGPQLADLLDAQADYAGAVLAVWAEP